MKRKSFGKSIVAKAVVLSVGLITTIYISDHIVQNLSHGKIYSDLNKLPYNKTGLLLGTGKYLKSGGINPYYVYRIQAAEDLLKSGKIQYLIISGDNSRMDYNEPEDMKKDLILQGIDSCCIYLDYAGFRTYDSMIRLKEIFGQCNVTVVSQAFHNERAVYIAAHSGITAIGYNARDVESRLGFSVRIREKLARVKVILDVLLGIKPKFLGEKVCIP